MLSTLNYSEAIEAFSSFISSDPKWYIDLKGSYYSFDADGKCFLHNVENDYNRMKDTYTPDRSFIRFLINDDYEVTKTFDNVSYSADFHPTENIVPLQFKTRLYTTDKVEFIDSREDTYKFSIPRDSSEDISSSSSKTIKHGRLYSWDAFIDSRGIAPSGWHIPSLEEWQTLITYSGGSEAGGKLKEVGTLNWNSPNTGATNESNFTALPSGIRYGSDINIGDECSFWALEQYYIKLEHDNGSVSTVYLYNTGGQAKSIRLIKDDSINEGDIIIDGDTYNSVTIGTQVWLKQNLAVKHYQNGDLIGSDFSGTIGAVEAYNGDENNVYAIVNIPESKALFASRLRGKYMVCDYEFKSNDGYTFRLPYIETTYRYSMI